MMFVELLILKEHLYNGFTWFRSVFADVETFVSVLWITLNLCLSLSFSITLGNSY